MHVWTKSVVPERYLLAPQHQFAGHALGLQCLAWTREATGSRALTKTATYTRHRPEETVLYQVVEKP